MSVTLIIGNNIDGTKPARATMKELRFGDGFCDSYSFKTMYPEQGGQGLIDNWPSQQNVTVDPIAQYFSHAEEIRMTGFADVFIPLTLDKWYSRQDVDTYIIELEDYRAEGTSSDADDEVGIKVKITRADTASDETLGTAWFDNASLLTTDILWEFNDNHGDGRWWPLYQIPGKNYTRVTLPKRTDSIRIRAYSSNTGEWVQKVIVFPRDDSQTLNSALTVDTSSLSIDEFGYMSWSPAFGGEGRITYHVYGGSTNDTSDMTKIGDTSNAHYQLDSLTQDFYGVCATSSTSQSKAWYQVVSNPTTP